jgi:hypothetical protein
MSEIENLDYIRNNGIKKFIEKENKKWISNKGILCYMIRNITNIWLYRGRSPSRSPSRLN